MKRRSKIFLSVFSAIAVLLLFVPFAALAQEELNEAEYRSVLESFDLSSFEELDSESRRLLDELGLSDFDYNSIVELSVSDFLLAVKDVMASGHAWISSRTSRVSPSEMSTPLMDAMSRTILLGSRSRSNTTNTLSLDGS